MRSASVLRMSNITSIPNAPGRIWGVLALAVAIIPVPFLVALNVLSYVVRTLPPFDVSHGVAAWIYGLVAALGLFFFPIFLVITTWLGVTAVRKPHPRGKLYGWIALAIVVVTIPLLCLGYLAWFG